LNRIEGLHVEQIRSYHFHLQRLRELVEGSTGRNVESHCHLAIFDQKEPLATTSFTPDDVSSQRSLDVSDGASNGRASHSPRSSPPLLSLGAFDEAGKLTNVGRVETLTRARGVLYASFFKFVVHRRLHSDLEQPRRAPRAFPPRC